MKWFEKKEIKDQEKLSPEQISYLKKPSITIFGPFNIIFRQHWDILLASLLMSFLTEFVVKKNMWYSVGLIRVTYGILEFGVYIFLIYFGLFHGRRLAWNRNKWESFDKFKESEKKWEPWAIVFIVITAISWIYSFLSH